MVESSENIIQARIEKSDRLLFSLFILIIPILAGINLFAPWFCGVFLLIKLVSHIPIEKYIVRFSYPLLIPFVLGLVYVGGHEIRHILRDLVYYSFPVIAVLLAYFAKYIYSKTDFYRLLVLSGSIYSIYYIIQAYVTFDTILFDPMLVRYSVGTGTPIIVISLLILLFSSLNVEIVKRVTLIILHLFILFLFYSRVYFGSFFFCLLIYSFYKFASRSKLIGGFLFLIFGLMAAALILPVFLSSKSDIAQKFMVSITEMFATEFVDVEDITHNWRAYEAYEALNELDNQSVFQKIFGMGFGKVIHFEYPLLNEEGALDEIPIFHNGFIYYLVKTGVLGVVCYIYFFINIAIKTIKRGCDDIFDLSLILGSITSVLLAILVVNGAHSGESFCFILVIIFLYIKEINRNTYG